jgi:hypothetical protein
LQVVAVAQGRMLLVEMVAGSLHLPARHMAVTVVVLQAHNQQVTL